MLEILDIYECNGKRIPLKYDYRKKRFASQDEMAEYKSYLSKKLKKPLYIMFKDYGCRL